MKNARRWCAGVAAGILLLLGGIALFVCREDPLFQYHSPDEHHTYYSYQNEAYQNPGIIKNSQYDTLSTGSSMSENHDEEYINRRFNAKTLKASYSGANSRNATDAIRLAIQSNPDLKRVFCSLDDHMFYLDWQDTGNQSPSFLTDRSILNDIYYWFNQDILYDYAIQNRYCEGKGAKTNQDYKSIFWYGMVYGESKVLSFVDGSPLTQTYERSTDLYERDTIANLQAYWIPLIESTPEVEYMLYFPPYSIMNWYATIQNGSTSAYMYMFEQIAKALLEYDNVRLFCFQDAYDVITNMWNYKDTTHYHFRINDWIIDRMAVDDERYRMTKENMDARFQELNAYVRSYPYETHLKNPFRLAESIVAYLECLNDERYLCFAQMKGEYDWVLVQDMLTQVLPTGMLMRTCEEQQGLYEICAGDKRSGGAFWTTHSVMPFEVEENGETNQWIEVDGIPYGNNADGLNLVVWDCEEQRVVDAVTYSLDGAWRTDRMNAWIDMPWLRKRWQTI